VSSSRLPDRPAEPAEGTRDKVVALTQGFLPRCDELAWSLLLHRDPFHFSVELG
jgi:hypothetical protein